MKIAAARLPELKSDLRPVEDFLAQDRAPRAKPPVP